MSDAPSTARPANRCRALLVSGAQCRNRAQRGKDLCFPHANYRFPTLPESSPVRVPLMEDVSSIQLVLSQVMHSLLSHGIDAKDARTAFYGCQVASSLLRVQSALKARPETPAAVEEPAIDVEQDEAGMPLGPRQPYRGPTGEFKPSWSFAKFMYEDHCKRFGLPVPTCAEEYPPEGWLTEEESRQDPVEWVARVKEHLAELKEAKKQQQSGTELPQDQSEEPMEAATAIPGGDAAPATEGEETSAFDLQAASPAQCRTRRRVRHSLLRSCCARATRGCGRAARKAAKKAARLSGVKLPEKPLPAISRRGAGPCLYRSACCEVALSSSR